MPVEKWTPERRRELTRTALVDSARHLFAQKGFEGASLDEIAENAGYTRGAIYKHFTNKEDLFFAVFDQFNQRVLGAFAEQNEIDPDAYLDPEAIAATWFRAELADPEMWALSVEFGLYEYRNPSVRERAVAYRRRNREMIAQFIEENAASTGFTLKMPAETMAALMLIASDGFIQAARLDPDAESLYAKFLELLLPSLVDVPDSPNSSV